MPDIPRNIKLPPTDRPLSAIEAFIDLDQRLQTGTLEQYRPTPLGFPDLDRHLGGGLHVEDLALVAGKQNVGKTIAALQAGRNNVLQDPSALTIMCCYEHGVDLLLHRLMCLESIDDPNNPHPQGGVTRSEIEAAVIQHHQKLEAGLVTTPLDLQWMIETLPGVATAWDRITAYGQRLWLVRGDSLTTTVPALEEYVRMGRSFGYHRILLIVDYAQRVPVREMSVGAALNDNQRIDLVMRGLKGLGLRLSVPVLSVAAADAEGLRQHRIHIENLWGPATVQYEPDVAIILNPDSLDGQTQARTVLMAIEKNRHGPTDVEFRHQLHGAYYCLATRGELIPYADSSQTERVRLRTQQQSGSRPGLDPLVALFLLAALEKQTGPSDDFTKLLLRAALADDGGLSLLEQVADQYGLSAMLEQHQPQLAQTGVNGGHTGNGSN